MSERRDLDERTELAELRALVPAPADLRLPPRRHAMHRESLMTQITQHPAPHQARRAKSSRRRGRRLVAVASVAALAAAAAVSVAVKFHPHSPVISAIQPAGLAPVLPAEAGSAMNAPIVLDRMATAVQSAPATAEVGPNQWFYIKEEHEFADEASTPWTMMPKTVREDWYGQQPRQQSIYRENGQTIPLAEASSASGDGDTKVDYFYLPTYAWIRSLPTDPRKLLQIAYDESATGGISKNVSAFRAFGALLTSAVLPPATEAAVYRAIALIPGVVMTPQATDLIGRTGFGIALTDATGERDEWIFSKTTYQYLGEREVQVTATNGAKAGTLVGLSAVLARGTADSSGGTPTLIP